jgi:hypothetical protein
MSRQGGWGEFLRQLAQSLSPYKPQNTIGQDNWGVGGDTGGVSAGDIGQIRQDEAPSVIDRINQMYQPQHSATDALNQALNQFPQRPNPTGMQKFLAAVQTLGQGGPAGQWEGSLIGYKAPHNVPEVYDASLYRDYNNQVDDWTRKIKPLEYAANEERYANALSERTSHDIAGEETARTKAATAEKRMNAYVDEMARRGGKLIYKAGGSAVWTFPNSNLPDRVVEGEFDTPGLRVKAQQAGALERAKIAASSGIQRAKIARDASIARGAGIYEYDDDNGEHHVVRLNPAAGDKPPAGAKSISKPGGAAKAGAANKDATTTTEDVDPKTGEIKQRVVTTKRAGAITHRYNPATGKIESVQPGATNAGQNR